MNKSILQNKSLDFAVTVVKLYNLLSKDRNEWVMSKQLLRSGTAIGASISEAKYAESKLDFIHKFGISQKECSEAEYWITLLYKTDYLSINEYNSLIDDNTKLMKMITASILTAKKSLRKQKQK